MPSGTTSPALDYKSLREAVEPLVADRTALAALFDAALKSRDPSADAAQPTSFIHGVTLGVAKAAPEHVEFDPAYARDALALSLLSVGEAQFAYDLLLNAFLRGFANQPGTNAEAAALALPGLLEPLPRLLFSKQQLTAELQRKTLSDASFADPAAVTNSVAQAQRRICRVDATAADGTTESGTGFLIGPSCVLTNWHVIEKLTSPALAAGEKLVVEFDFSQAKSVRPRGENLYAAHADWLVVQSPTGTKEPAGAAAYRTLGGGTVVAEWWMDHAFRQAWCDTLDGSLDFAVIRLKGSPGARRAHYDLWSAAAAEAPTSAECFVLHHANARGQAFNTGATFAALAHGSRLFHSASTEGGSSGAMLFDISGGRPIGLHYLALGPEAEPGKEPVVPACNVNVAVSLAAVAAAIPREKREAIALASELMLHGGCLINDDPVFGRGDLLTQLTEMRAGSRQLLWIEVPRDPNGDPRVNYGRSYSARIVETLFPEPANLHIKIDAADIPPDAKALFRLLADRIIGDQALAAALTIPEKETTAEAYDKVLFDEFAKLVLQYRKRTMIWLTLDDLDVHDLPDTDSRRFLDRLYAQIGTLPQLRIVLIGLKFQLQSIDENRLARNAIDFHDLPKLEADLRKWLDEKTAVAGPMIAMARDVVASLSMAGVNDGDAMRQLHMFARDRLNPVLNSYFTSRP